MKNQRILTNKNKTRVSSTWKKSCKNNSSRSNARNNLRINRPPNALFFHNPFFLFSSSFFFVRRSRRPRNDDMYAASCKCGYKFRDSFMAIRVSARKDRAYASIKRNCYTLPSSCERDRQRWGWWAGEERVCVSRRLVNFQLHYGFAACKA